MALTRKPAGRFGDYNCDSPWALVESAAKAMKSKHGDNIEFVLWTGELCPWPQRAADPLDPRGALDMDLDCRVAGSGDGYLKIKPFKVKILQGDGVSHSGLGGEHQLEVLQNLTHLLQQTFSSQFVFPVLGHDDPNPALQYGQGYKDVANLWRHWLPTDAIQTFNEGGYYTIENKGRRLRIIALNTNLCSDMVGNEADPYGQWSWLEETLQKSQNNRETVYIVGHMPPGVDERQNSAFLSPYIDAFQERFNQRYLKLVRRYSDIIVGQFFGHFHSDSFRIIYSESGRPVSWIFLAPAVSPRRTPTGGPNNPGLRLYKYDTNTGQVLDYRQYYLDLANANMRDVADWQPEYNLTDYYGLNEVSPTELHNLVESFTQEGSPLFARYYKANSVKYYSTPKAGGCDASCIHTHYCAITRLDYPEFRSCLETAPSALSSAAETTTVIHWNVLVLLFLTFICSHSTSFSVS